MDNRKKELIRAYKEKPATGGAYVIENTVTSRKLLLCETDLKGSKNKFDFMSRMGSCPNSRLQKDWRQYGPACFAFTVLEEIEQKETQTLEEFREDLVVLEAIWREKLGEDNLY